LVATAQKGRYGQRRGTREKRPMVFCDAAAVKEKGPANDCDEVEIQILSY